LASLARLARRGAAWRSGAAVQGGRTHSAVSRGPFEPRADQVSGWSVIRRTYSLWGSNDPSLVRVFNGRARRQGSPQRGKTLPGGSETLDTLAPHSPRDSMAYNLFQRHAMQRDGAAALIGSSAVMRGVRERIERVAATDFTALVDGESGVGKELVARQIHEISGRRRGPFVAVNCAALVESLLEAELFGIEDRTATGVRGRRGKFELAEGGTLFLDEVSDLSPSAQAKLLRAIQDLAVERVGGHGLRRINTRVVAATNRRLSTM